MVYFLNTKKLMCAPIFIEFLEDFIDTTRPFLHYNLWRLLMGKGMTRFD